LRYGKSVLGAGLEDDFFYYAGVARHFAVNGASTFDGVHLTNGYHPLWMLVVASLTKVFGVGGMLKAVSDVPFAASLETLQCIMLAAIAWFVVKAARVFCGPFVSIAIQLLVSSFTIMMVRSGMEVGLTLTLAFGLLYWRVRTDFRWSSVSSLLYGFIGALLILSRLDTALLVLLLFIFDVLPAKKEGSFARSISFCLGLAPVFFYFFVNETVFHTLMPVSGTAKQLRLHHTLTHVALLSFLNYFRRLVSPLTGPAVFVTIYGLLSLPWQRNRAISDKRGFLVALLLFAPIQLLTIATLSDWPIWLWYLYPWVISGLVGAMIVFAGRGEHSGHSRIGLLYVGAAAMLLIVECVGVARASNPAKNNLYLASEDIRDFAKQHPGTYAMGDRGGTVGYLISQPVIQLEGLTMDKDYLAHIRARESVNDVLKDYGVRYYIATNDVPRPPDCYLVKEPSQAGPDSIVMLGTICGQPVATYVHGKFTTHIFDMQR